MESVGCFLILFLLLMLVAYGAKYVCPIIFLMAIVVFVAWVVAWTNANRRIR